MANDTDELASAEEEARRQIENTKERAELWTWFDVLKGFETTLLAKYPLLERSGVVGPPARMLADVRRELREAFEQLATFQDDHRGLSSYRPCAGASETVAEAARRILVERGVPESRYAAIMGVASAEVVNSRERQAARRDRERALATAKTDLQANRRLLLEVDAGRHFYNLLGPIPRERIEAEIARLEKQVASLRPRRRTTTKGRRARAKG